MARRSLAASLVEVLENALRDGTMRPGDRLPTESRLMVEHGVSRTVVREALSRLQAAGRVQTRHGIGSFVVEPPREPAFRVPAGRHATLQDVVALIELRMGLETEAAALAAQRRTPEQLRALRTALDDIAAAVEAGEDAVEADFRFHEGVALATGNAYFGRLLRTFGARLIPRSRLDAPADDGRAPDAARLAYLAYLRRVNAEHEGIYDAIAAGDAEAARAAMRTHLSGSRARRLKGQVVR